MDGGDILLQLELRPLRVCALKKDHKMMQKLWRRLPVWDSCHFYSMVEFLIEQKDSAGLNKLLSPQDKFVNHFYEPRILQDIVDANPEMPSAMSTKLMGLIESYEGNQ